MAAALSMSDEADLSWFFSRGQSVFERSTSSSVLEKAKLFSIAAEYPVATWPKLLDGEVVYSDHEITARPTAETQSASVEPPDHEVLVKYARVSRRLLELERRSPIACAVLEAFYGDLGCAWSLTKQGRITAVLPLTKAGTKLLRRSEAAGKKQGAELDLSHAKRLENVVLGKHTQVVREQLSIAVRQAEKMVVEAREHWRVCKEPKAR